MSFADTLKSSSSLVNTSLFRKPTTRQVGVRVTVLDSSAASIASSTSSASSSSSSSSRAGMDDDEAADSIGSGGAAVEEKCVPRKKAAAATRDSAIIVANSFFNEFVDCMQNLPNRLQQLFTEMSTIDYLVKSESMSLLLYIYISHLVSPVNA